MERRHATPNQPPSMTAEQVGVISFIAGMMFFCLISMGMEALI